MIWAQSCEAPADTHQTVTNYSNWLLLHVRISRQLNAINLCK